jgi:hypothetical protein
MLVNGDSGPRPAGCTAFPTLPDGRAVPIRLMHDGRPSMAARCLKLRTPTGIRLIQYIARRSETKEEPPR